MLYNAMRQSCDQLNTTYIYSVIIKYKSCAEIKTVFSITCVRSEKKVYF